MSLRYQISVRILFISLFVLLIGGSISIWQARLAVKEEVDSSISLAWQLIKIGIDNSKAHQTDWMFGLSSLEQTRHLNIQLKKPNGEIIDVTRQSNLEDGAEIPPDWFIYLVVGEYPSTEFPIESAENNNLTLIIQANPLDETAEVWDETVSFFSSLLLLVLLTFLAIHLVFDKTLQAIQTIVEHLRQIELGKYEKRLPVFNTQEYDNIAAAINHMTGVLDNTQKQNKALTQHSLQIQEEERQRLSQELHDEFGQSLTAIKVMAVTAAHEKSDTQQITSSIIEICDHLMTVVRSMMTQLHPLILTELGLKATLEDMLNHWEERHVQTSFNLHCDDEVESVDQAIVIQIYRVVQESLTNIVRHANASHVTICVEIMHEPKRLSLSVTDDGKGCDLDQLESGFGLLGIKERVKLLGGEISFNSQPGQGLQINIQIPLP